MSKIPLITVSTIDLRPSLMSVLKSLSSDFGLKRVVTASGIDRASWLAKAAADNAGWIPETIRKGLRRRIAPDVLDGKLTVYGGPEFLRLLAGRLGSQSITHHIWLWSELYFDNYVARHYVEPSECIYGMEHSSLATFQEQKKKKGLCILRQVIPHAERIRSVMLQEMSLYPEFGSSYQRLFIKDLPRSIERKTKEYALADLIIANSDFVKDSFAGYPELKDKVISIPTGCPPVLNGHETGEGSSGEKTVFLFAGPLSIRKGVHRLLNAWESGKGRFGELWLAGESQLEGMIPRMQQKGIKYWGKLGSHELERLYREADVLILPTLLEGLAHTVLEALSAGLPVITTSASGCGQLVEHMCNGYRLENAEEATITEALDWAASHKKELHAMRSASKNMARQWTVEASNRLHSEQLRKFFKDRI